MNSEESFANDLNEGGHPHPPDVAGVEAGHQGTTENDPFAPSGGGRAETPRQEGGTTTAQPPDGFEAQVDEDWAGFPRADADPRTGQVSFFDGMSTAIHAEKVYQSNFFRVSPGDADPSKAQETKTDEDEARPLLELTTPLPSRDSSKFSFDDLPDNFKRWEAERLIFISCPDEDMALDAAYALVERLNLPADGRRLLDFARVAKNGLTPNIFFLRRRDDSEAGAAVVVDALGGGEEARPFLDSLIFARGAGLLGIKDNLTRSNVYMLCLVDPADIDERAAPGGRRRTHELKCVHWRIPFLRVLLEHHFPPELRADLERDLLKQRERGWWSPDEDEFCQELRRHIREGKLPEVVAARRGPVAPAPAHTIFKGDTQPDDTVIYVAAFFPGLNPREFNRVVSLLLPPPSSDATKPPPPERGETAPAQERSGESPARLWQDAPDAVLHRCHLISALAGNSAKVISFDNHLMREELREYIGRKYSMFIEAQFERVQQLGLLFSRSAKVAEGAMQLALGMAASYPEDFGGAWLAETVRRFDPAVAPGEGGEATAAALFTLPARTDQGRARQLFYQRLANLVRLMLDAGGQEDAVEAFFHQLILSKRYRHVLELTRRLKNVPGFDEFKWLKQLLDRGDKEARDQVFSYLFSDLKNARAEVYQILRAIEPWLPETDRPVTSYSESNRLALRLLPVYSYWALARYDLSLYGSWPSQYPLFTFRDAEAATGRFRLLARWLCHPALRLVPPEYIHSEGSICLLFELWAFVLLDREHDADAPPSPSAAITAGDEPGPRVVLDILLKQIAQNSAPDQQAVMLAFWENSGRKMLELLAAEPYGGEARGRLLRRREVVVEMVARFREIRDGLNADRA